MSGLKGNPAKLKGLMRHVRGVGTVAAQRIAARLAPAFSMLTRQAFAAQQSPYGDPWAPGVDGSLVTLVKSGRLRGALGFTSTGTIVRALLAVPYLRFHIGKRKILPSGKPPQAWLARMRDETREELTRQLGRAA